MILTFLKILGNPLQLSYTMFSQILFLTWLRIGNARSVQILKQNRNIKLKISYLRFNVSK